MRRIKKAKIRFLSLVPKGANTLPVTYKADEDAESMAFDIRPLIKVTDDFDEQGELLAVVYAPNLLDSQGEFATSDVIKQMMYDAAKEGVGIDIRHNEQAVDKSAAYVAESFLIQKGDPRFAEMTNYDGDKVDVTGGWGTVIKIDDVNLRKMYREGNWQGISMGGTAWTEEVADDIEKASHVSKLLNKLARMLGLKNLVAYDNMTISGEVDMTPEDLTKITEAISKTVTEAIAKMAPAPTETKKEAEAKPLEAPTFKGDPGNSEDVRKHREALQRWQLVKDVDWNDSESVAAYETKLAEIKTSKAGRSRQDPDVDGAPSNEDQDCRKAAGNMVKFINKRRGLKIA